MDCTRAFFVRRRVRGGQDQEVPVRVRTRGSSRDSVLRDWVFLNLGSRGGERLMKCSGEEGGRQVGEVQAPVRTRRNFFA